VPVRTYLETRCALVDQALDRLLPGEEIAPATLHRAMRYSMFAGGKRLRPVLVLAAAEACGGAVENALPAACAVECLHTYSLIHDDLPCMDDDDLRRGRPTSHKVFGDAIAVLAGDALQALAFESVSRMSPAPGYTGADYVCELAQAAGSRHLIAGQVMDLEGEGKRLSADDLRTIHEGKTAALLTCCTRLGGMSAGCSSNQLDALTRFGRALGLAFQVIDDILDVTQTSEKLGKTAGKDLAAEKATYPSILGMDASRAEAARLTALAHDALGLFGDAAQPLRLIADYLLAREY
jgi:geranylgeranyl diphosphate synthase, type II